MDNNPIKDLRNIILEIKMTDKEICDEYSMMEINCGLEKGHTTNHLAVISWGEGETHSYSLEELLLDADIVARLREETKNLENYLMKHPNELPPQSKLYESLKLKDFQKILTGKY